MWFFFFGFRHYLLSSAFLNLMILLFLNYLGPVSMDPLLLTMIISRLLLRSWHSTKIFISLYGTHLGILLGSASWNYLNSLFSLFLFIVTYFRPLVPLDPQCYFSHHYYLDAFTCPLFPSSVFVLFFTLFWGVLR